MIIICEECGKKYQVTNLDMIKDDGGFFNCSECKNIISVDGSSSVSSQTSSIQETFQDADYAQKQAVSAEPFEKEKKRSKAPKERFRFGLVPKMVLLLLVVSLLPVMLLWFVSFNDTSQRVQTSLETELATISKGLVGTVDGWIGANLRVLKAMARTDAIKSMQAYQQEPLLKAVQKEYPWMYLVFTLDKTGMNIARNDGKKVRNYADRQYYKNIMAGKELTWQNLIGKTSKKPALVLAVPIRKNGQLVGVLANAMTIDAISKEVATWKRGKTGHAFLIDEKGKVVAHQNAAYTIEQKNLSKHPLINAYKSGERGHVEYADSRGSAKSVGYVRNTEFGWLLAVQQDQSEAYASLHKSQRFNYILLAVTFLFVILIASISARKIAKPIVELTQIADKISVGQLDMEISSNRKDEIGDLTEAIARMQESITLSIQRFRKRKR